MSSNLSLLVIFPKHVNKIAENWSSSFQATRPGWFLFPIHVDNTAGRTGCARKESCVLGKELDVSTARVFRGEPIE